MATTPKTAIARASVAKSCFRCRRFSGGGQGAHLSERFGDVEIGNVGDGEAAEGEHERDREQVDATDLDGDDVCCSRGRSLLRLVLIHLSNPT